MKLKFMFAFSIVVTLLILSSNQNVRKVGVGTEDLQKIFNKVFCSGALCPNCLAKKLKISSKSKIPLNEDPILNNPFNMVEIDFLQMVDKANFYIVSPSNIIKA